MNDILNTILKDTYSLTQLKHRLRVLKTSLLKTFFGTIQPTSGESEPTPEVLPPEDLNWLKSLPPAFYRKFGRDNVYQVFTDLDTQIASLQTLVIYLPFEPDDQTLNQIGAVARKTFFPTLILDIKLNPGLIAGTALSWKGRMRDYSLQAKITGRKEEVLQEFKKFLR